MIEFLFLTAAFIFGCILTEWKNKQAKSKVEVIYEEWE